MNDMERHIQQTNDRLQCIREHLSTPQGFQHAARELLEWCSDPRAFQGPFESGLIHCLTIVSRVAAQPGFDLDLGYRLLAVCAAHREKFTPKSAGLLSVWCEELGRLLLLRHQKSRSPDSVTGKNPANMQPQLKNFQSMPPSDANGIWQGPPHQALSVVTTVWGVTQTTQSGPFTHTTPGYTNTTMSTTPYTQPPQGFPGNPMQKGNPYNNPQAMPYRRDSAYAGYPPTPTTPGLNPVPMTAGHEYQAPPGALSAAAFVAAAATATATATATASMVALQEQQQQQQQQQMNMNMNMNNQYPHPHPHPHPQQQVGMGQQYANQFVPQQRSGGPMGMGQGPGPMVGGKAAMANMYQGQRRPAPYPNPQQMMQQKRGQYQNGTQFMQQPMYNQQYMQKSQYPQQPMSSPSYVPQSQMRPNGPSPPYSNTQNMYLMPNQYSRPQPPQPTAAFNQMNGQQGYSPAMNYQHSPIPGNPTPPITPGSTMPPYVSPIPQDIKPNCQDIKPHMPIQKEAEELRLTFPVRDGVVLPPFRLEHNLAVSNHVFHLRESVYHTLMWRSDLELQLKCFHHEDRHMNTNWPASVTVSVNARPLDIQRGDNKTSHKPLYLKDVCQTGRNTIQITVTACCCSHLFVLQLVHRPSVRSVLQGLLRKRLLPAPDCVNKIKRNFSMAVSSNGPTLHEDGIEQTAMKILLKCPITYRRITLPARGHECKHIQCFDLESYLQLNCERGAWRCPVCNKQALLEGLEIDQYIWAILDKLNHTEYDEVTIDSSASWKPTQVLPVKDEEPDSCGNSRWLKAMSPSSMTLPTTHSMDLNQPSPYSMPPSVGPPGQYTSPSYNGSHPLSPATPGGGYQADFPGGMLSMSEANLAVNDMVSRDKLQRSNSHQLPSSPQETAMLRMNERAMSQPSLANHPSPATTQPHPIPTPPQLTPATDDQTTSDLNFDPAAIINGDAPTPTLDLLPENIGDPMELLSYLGPTDGGSGDATEAGSNANASSANDDLLALFENT